MPPMVGPIIGVLLRPNLQQQNFFLVVMHLFATILVLHYSVFVMNLMIFDVAGSNFPAEIFPLALTFVRIVSGFELACGAVNLPVLLAPFLLRCAPAALPLFISIYLFPSAALSVRLRARQNAVKTPFS